jgi:hypothetical protein
MPVMPQVHRKLSINNLVKHSHGQVTQVDIYTSNFDQSMGLPCSSNSAAASSSFVSIAADAVSEASDRGIRTVARNVCCGSILSYESSNDQEDEVGTYERAVVMLSCCICPLYRSLYRHISTGS